MKKIFLFLMLLIASFAVVACSDAGADAERCYTENFENKHKIELAGMVSSYGMMRFEYGTYNEENGTVTLPVKYAFYVNEFVHEGTVTEYKILLNNGTEEIEFEFDKGPYDANDYVYIGDYFEGKYDFPISDVITLPRTFFTESNSHITAKIVGFEGDKTEESQLTRNTTIYYQALGDSILISEYECPIESELLIDCKYKDDPFLDKKLDTAEATLKYDIKYKKNIFLKHQIDCFASWRDSLGVINENNVELCDKYTIIGSRIGKNKIQISRYLLTDRSRHDLSVTLTYSGAFSLDFCLDGSAYYLYLWDDNTVLSFDGNSYDGTKKLYAVGTILDNAENERIRADIQARCDVTTVKSDGEFDFHALLKSGEYKSIIAKDKNGEEYEIYVTKFTEIFNTFIDIISDTFEFLFSS